MCVLRAPTKTAPFGAVELGHCFVVLLFLLLVFFRLFLLGLLLLRIACRGCRRRSGGSRSGSCGGRGTRERRGDPALHDRDRLNLPTLELEDGHLGVLAVA